MDLDAEVRAAIPAVNLKSSPGVPWSQFGSNNETLFENHEDLIVNATVERIGRLISTPYKELKEMDAVELVRRGLADPVRLFIKPEPHQQKKIKSGKLRLICSVSIVDQLVERVMAWRQNAYEIDHWETLPSKPGIGFDDDKIHLMWQSVRHTLFEGNLAEADISGWDWSVQEWELWAEAEMRVALAGSDERMAALLRARIRCLSLSVFCLSSGEMIAQTEPGVMKSGSYLTSSSNSRIRVLAADLVGAECVAMGDDSLETWIPDAKNRYSNLGHLVKQYERCGLTFGFCSHRYENGVAYPESWARTLFRLLNQKTTDTEEKFRLVLQFQEEIRHHPDRAQFLAVLSEVGWFSDESN